MPPKKNQAKTDNLNQQKITNFFIRKENRTPSDSNPSSTSTNAESKRVRKIKPLDKRRREEKRNKYRNPNEGATIIDLTNTDDEGAKSNSTATTPIIITDLDLSRESPQEPVATTSRASTSCAVSLFVGHSFLTPLLTPSAKNYIQEDEDETQRINIKHEPFDNASPSERSSMKDTTISRTLPLSPYYNTRDNDDDILEENIEIGEQSESLIPKGETLSQSPNKPKIIISKSIFESMSESDSSQPEPNNEEYTLPLVQLKDLASPETDFEDEDENPYSRIVNFVQVINTPELAKEALTSGRKREKTPSSKSSSTKARRLLDFSPYKETKSPKGRATRFDAVRNLNKNSPNRSSPSKMNSPRRLNFQPGTSVAPSPKKLTYFQHYYLENFLLITKPVIDDENNHYLFNETETELFKKFFTVLSESSKCLYVRLFNRKWQWISPNTLEYKEIASDLIPFVTELHNHNFLDILTKENGLDQDLESTLKILKSEQLSLLAEKMGIRKAKKNKELTIEALLKISKTQKTLTNESSSMKILKVALEILQPMYKLNEFAKNFFSRLFLIYSPPPYWDDEAKSSNDLLTLHLSNQGKMEFPTFKVIKERRLFYDRNCLLRFQESLSLFRTLEGLLEEKDWLTAQLVTKDALNNLENILTNEEERKNDEEAPTFLRTYTAGSVLARMVWAGVDAFQKTKDYEMANKLIEILLKQKCYLNQYRGRWLDRLFVNMTHLKVGSETILSQMKDALSNDEHLQDAYKYSLSQRYLKLKSKVEKGKGKAKRGRKRKKRPDEDSDTEDDEPAVDPIEDAEPFVFQLKNTFQENFIEGEMMQKENPTGKSLFISANRGTGASLLSVEDFVFDDYKNKGFQHYIHGEGSVPVTLFGLIFWDIIYQDVPDAFFNKHNPYPQDLYFEDFYIRRKADCEKMIQNLRFCWSMNDLLNHIEKKWEENKGKLCICNWEVFRSLEEFKGFVRCLQPRQIADICSRMMKNLRHARSGFPDLTIWNDQDQECKFVEVKGPNDKLSPKQFIWIDFLMSIGISVEVCHVKSVSNKRISKRKS